MNRRSFLKGVLAAALVSKVPVCFSAIHEQKEKLLAVTQIKWTTFYDIINDTVTARATVLFGEVINGKGFLKDEIGVDFQIKSDDYSDAYMKKIMLPMLERELGNFIEHEYPKYRYLKMERPEQKFLGSSLQPLRFTP